MQNNNNWLQTETNTKQCKFVSLSIISAPAVDSIVEALAFMWFYLFRKRKRSSFFHWSIFLFQADLIETRIIGLSLTLDIVKMRMPSLVITIH